jgi:hypothetical protein
MKRREFIALLSGVAAGWPLAARAQQSIPAIGYLAATTLDDYTTPQIGAFRQGLKESGFVEEQNLTIARTCGLCPFPSDGPVCWAYSKIASSLPSALAAKQVTSTIPIDLLLADIVAKRFLVPERGIIFQERVRIAGKGQHESFQRHIVTRVVNRDGPEGACRSGAHRCRGGIDAGVPANNRAVLGGKDKYG